jgi:thymidylate synthase (FAD)
LETDNKQIKEQFSMQQQKVVDTSIAAYKWAVENGIAKEQARVVLPEGLTMSRMYMKGTLRNWLHYVDVRTDKATQKEHREIAKECGIILKTCFPSIAETLEDL